MKYTSIRVDNSKRIIAMMVAVCICALSTLSIAADESMQDSSQGKGKVSLIEQAPAVYKQAKRDLSFYGDASTTRGSFSERSNLLGDLNGVRDTLIDNGVYLDAGVTQFLQGNLSGGERDSPDPRTNGSTDLWLWLDTGKADLWSGGALFAHAEANWGTSINEDVGSILPANFDATMPRANNPPSAKLSELYYLQALPNNLLASFGKQDMAAWADTNLFANNVRTQFSYMGLVDNPMAGVFFPYTGIGAWLDWALSKEHNLVWVWSQSDAKAGQTGFDNLFNSDNSYAFQYVFSPTIGNKPGNYLIAALYSTKDVDEFTISRERLLGELVGALPVADKSNNYAVIANFDQYLWVADEGAAASDGRPRGVGVFARAGWEPEDRNTIDQFYSFGIGGYGVLIPGRNDDNWGFGWAGSHISDDLRQLTATKRSWEHAYEIFYNFELTPAVHWTLNAQAIRPADKSTDTAYTLGARLQLDF